MDLMNIELRMAKQTDIEAILRLHYRYQINSISDEDKKGGFITTAFTEDELLALIQQENGLFLALIDDTIVAYAMAASWLFWSNWPLFEYMTKSLSEVNYAGYHLNINNSYQYGPVCVDTGFRGMGVFEKIFHYSLQSMSSRYPVLVTFINKLNSRSYSAHINKAGLEVIKEFEYNGNAYYELACLTNSSYKNLTQKRFSRKQVLIND